MELEEPLINKAIRLIDEKLQDAIVRDFVVNKDWDWNLLSDLLTADIVRKIQTILPFDPYAGSDRLTWKDHHVGCFSIKSAYFTRVPALVNAQVK